MLRSYLYHPAIYANPISFSRLIFIGLIVGTVFSELFCSGRLSDWLLVKVAARNGTKKTPEMRLWLVYPAALLTSVGLIVWGISIDRNYHWMVGQVAFAFSESRASYPIIHATEC